MGLDDLINEHRLMNLKGRKDDSWLMVVIKEVQVHIVLDEYREDLDLEFRWLNPPPQEMIHKWKTYETLKKKSDSIDYNEDTFKQPWSNNKKERRPHTKYQPDEQDFTDSAEEHVDYENR
mmetsp:Transcript_19692/g.14143  ORF Transcript_19692/g.14143 Transcript_19692/m.14143 type:complete len:120 (+) Transcript_19692:630-989(+)